MQHEHSFYEEDLHNTRSTPTFESTHADQLITELQRFFSATGLDASALEKTMENIHNDSFRLY